MFEGHAYFRRIHTFTGLLIIKPTQCTSYYHDDISLAELEYFFAHTGCDGGD